MLLQIGPCIVSAKINGVFTRLFDAADVSVTLKTERVNRINDGMIVESAYTVVGVSFEIKANQWSIKTLYNLSVFDEYDYSSEAGSCAGDGHHIFQLSNLTAVNTLWLKFESFRVSKSSYVELPKAMLSGDIGFTYPVEGQGDVSISGEAQKDPNEPLIILNISARLGEDDL